MIHRFGQYLRRPVCPKWLPFSIAPQQTEAIYELEAADVLRFGNSRSPDAFAISSRLK
jgi:hypothetical protein